MKTLSLRVLWPYAGWLGGIGFVGYLVSQHPLFFKEGLLALPVYTLLALALFNMLSNASQGVAFYFLWPDGQLPVWRHALLPFIMHSANIALSFRCGETVPPLLIKKWDPRQKLKTLFYWILIDKWLSALTLMPFVMLATHLYFPQHRDLVAGLWAVLVVGVGTWYVKAKHKPRRLLWAYVFSSLYWLFSALFFYTLFASVEAAIGLMVGTSLGSAIPGFPAAIGVYEAAFVWVSTHMGIAKDQAAVMAVASHGASIVSTLLIGLPFAAIWGWPSHEDHLAAAPQRTSLQHRITNATVLALGIVSVTLSGVRPWPYRPRSWGSK